MWPIEKWMKFLSSVLLWIFNLSDFISIIYYLKFHQPLKIFIWKMPKSRSLKTGLHTIMHRHIRGLIYKNGEMKKNWPAASGVCLVGLKIRCNIWSSLLKLHRSHCTKKVCYKGTKITYKWMKAPFFSTKDLKKHQITAFDSQSPVFQHVKWMPILWLLIEAHTVI